MNQILEKIKDLKIVPVAVIDNREDALLLAKALCDAGLPCAEVTFRTKEAAECLKAMHDEFPQMFLGAGTVLTREQADRAIDAGAEFIISPGFDESIVEYCLSKNVVVIPGCATASDMSKAVRYGLECVKFFPAEANGGVKTLKALAAPFKNLKFIPTGGIFEKNIKTYLEMPSVIACGGSYMVSSSLVKAGKFDEIEALTRKALMQVKGSDEGNAISVCKTDIKPCPDGRVVTFGEIMLRLAPEGYTRFVQADSFGATFGGGEANVSVSLANFGMDTSFVTKLPSNDIGQMAVNSLRRYGVDTSYIVRGGERIGIYYLEKGASQRPSKVIYDRAGSAVAKALKSDFDWDKIFEGASWFHFTGITPALSDEVSDICEDALINAKRKGLVVSCDLNYRNKLWSKEKAGKVMERLCKYVDVCIANEEDAGDVFGIKAENTGVTQGIINAEGYKSVAKQLAQRFGFKYVAITLRESISANDNNWAAVLYDGREYYFSRKYALHIVDRVGGGDSFGAGLIYSLMNGQSPKEAIEFAVAASALKHSVEGDYNMVSVEDVMKLAGGDGSGRVVR